MASIKFVFVVRLSASQHLASDCPINPHQGVARGDASVIFSLDELCKRCQQEFATPFISVQKIESKCFFTMQSLLWGDLLGGNPIALQHFSFYEGAARREKKLRRPSARNGAEMSGKRARERATGSTDGWMDVTCILPRASIDLPPPSHRPPVFHTKISTNKGHKVRGKC